MTESMKFLSLVVGGIMVIIAAIATPISIVYALYMWGGEGHAIGYAAWEAAKAWICMVVLVVPGIVFVTIGQ